VYSATKAAVRVLSYSLRVEAQGKTEVTGVRPTGVMGIGLGGGVVNPQAFVGLTGQRTERLVESSDWAAAVWRPRRPTSTHVRYRAITPEDLVARSCTSSANHGA
jgi:NAD(P)-dependent dehydrogenase (short-subunit alcohol dehydrogenase family)